MALAVTVLAGCSDSDLSPRPTVSLDPSKPTADAASTSQASGTARDNAGNAASVSISLGEPRSTADVSDEGVQACQTLMQTLGVNSGLAVPLTVKAQVTSSSPADMVVRLSDVSELGDAGQVSSLPDAGVFWAVTYSDTPPQCARTDGGVVHWPASASSIKSWSTWLVVGAEGAHGRDVTSRLVLRPSVQLGNSGFATFEFASPAARTVVHCSANDPAAGDEDYLAIDPVVALEHGCRSSADQQSSSSGSTPSADRICLTGYPNGTSHTVGKVQTYDREGSLEQVCDGLGAPEGLQLTAPMKCALIAAAATAGGPPGSGEGIENTACEATSIANAYKSRDWLGYAAGKACGYFSDVFATGVGVFAAGATSETGPGAVAVGVTTYKALATGLKIACGGLFDGGAKSLGNKFEGDHESHVAADIVNHGKCLAINQTHGTSFAAVKCP